MTAGAETHKTRDRVTRTFQDVYTAPGLQVRAPSSVQSDAEGCLSPSTRDCSQETARGAATRRGSFVPGPRRPLALSGWPVVCILKTSDPSDDKHVRLHPPRAQVPWYAILGNHDWEGNVTGAASSLPVLCK